MATDESDPRPQDDERYHKTLDAIVAAPALSIRAALFSLYAEGNDEFKSFIEDRVSGFAAVANLQIVQTPSVATTTVNCEETLEQELEKKLPFCIHCEEEFDPEDEDNDGYCGNYHPGESTTSRPTYRIPHVSYHTLTSFLRCRI